HTANRAIPWAFLANFWVHGAGINTARWCRCCSLFLATQNAFGVGVKFCFTMAGAKIPRLARVLASMFCSVRINIHPTDRVFNRVLTHLSLLFYLLATRQKQENIIKLNLVRGIKPVSLANRDSLHAGKCAKSV